MMLHTEDCNAPSNSNGGCVSHGSTILPNSCSVCGVWALSACARSKQHSNIVKTGQNMMCDLRVMHMAALHDTHVWHRHVAGSCAMKLLAPVYLRGDADVVLYACPLQVPARALCVPGLNTFCICTSLAEGHGDIQSHLTAATCIMSAGQGVFHLWV